MRSVIFSIFMLCSVFTLVKAQSVILQGKVTDEVGSPMDMVHIRLSKGSIGTLSNFKGEYELRVGKSDTLRVIFTSLGYKRVERVVSTNVEGNGRVSLNVQMQPNTAVIQDVEVVARQRNNDGVEKIEAKNIKHTPTASGNAVEDMIGTMAGVTMNNEMSSQYSVRGGSFDENLIYVNGIEVYRPQLIRSGQQEGLSFINSSMVGSIGFSTGGFAPEYGDKMSSVLDITYKRPERFEAEANVNLMGASASVGQSTKRFSQLHGIRFKRNTSLLSSLETKGEYDPRFFDYQTFLTYDLNDNFSVSFLGNIATNRYRFTPKTRETSFGTMENMKKFMVYFDGQERDKFDTYFGAITLNYKGLHNTDLRLLASAFKTDEEVTYDISGEYWLDNATEGGQGSLGVGAYHEHARNYLDASVVAVSLKGTTQIGHNKISYGVGLRGEYITDRIAEWERRDSAGYTLPHVDQQVNMVYNLHSFYDNVTTKYEAFVQDNYGWNALGGRFYLVAGLRLLYWTYNREALLSPRASLAYTPDSKPGLTLRLATGIYSQSPFYKEYRKKYIDANGNSMIVMNPDIKSQRSVQVIAGADYTFSAYNRPFKLTAEAYYKNISDYVPYTVDNVQIRYLGYNNGSAFSTGIDMKLFGEFVEGTDSWLSLSLNRSQEKFDRLKTSRPTEQRYSIGLFFSDFWPGNDSYKVFVRGVMNDGLPTYSPLGGRESGMFRTPAYKRIDIGASRVWNADNCRFMSRGRWNNVKEMTLGIDVFNIMDFDNVNSYYWVTSVDNMQYAVPNYLTSRMLSISLSIKL